MEKQTPSHAFRLIVAVAPLLLPVLYVGSYLFLLDPSAAREWIRIDGRGAYVYGYRYFGWEGDTELPSATRIAPSVFWPLEQIDKKLRPAAWGIRNEPTPNISAPVVVCP